MSGPVPDDGASSGPAKGLRILLVEDTEINQFVATRMLRKYGCTVDVAEDGLQGVARASEQGYALILMDCSMPNMDGFEATRRIREGGGPNAQTPIVAVTASGRDEIRQRCFDSGMDEFLEKPMDRDALRDTLRRAGDGSLRGS